MHCDVVERDFEREVAAEVGVWPSEDAQKLRGIKVKNWWEYLA